MTFDGSEYVVLRALARGAPLAIVYPVEGTPLIISNAAVMKDAPHPNAARLFINFLFSREGRQFLVDNGQQCCLDPDVTEPAARMPLSQVKLLTARSRGAGKGGKRIKRKVCRVFRRIAARRSNRCSLALRPGQIIDVRQVGSCECNRVSTRREAAGSSGLPPSALDRPRHSQHRARR